MATLDKFDLSEFSVQGDEVLLDIPVTTPVTPFRIHPDRSRMLKTVYLKRSDDHGYLIHPDVARSGQLSGLCKAALYEGVKSNGASFVLPLTDARPGREERTESLREAIAAARHGWVAMVSDAEQDSGITTPQNSKKFQTMEPRWFDGEFSRLIETAFRGHIILTQQEALARFRKTSHREITEDEGRQGNQKNQTPYPASLLLSMALDTAVFLFFPRPLPKTARHSWRSPHALLQDCG